MNGVKQIDFIVYYEEYMVVIGCRATKVHEGNEKHHSRI